jgi:hypothetical protein
MAAKAYARGMPVSNVEVLAAYTASVQQAGTVLPLPFFKGFCSFLLLVKYDAAAREHEPFMAVYAGRRVTILLRC